MTLAVTLAGVALAVLLLVNEVKHCMTVQRVQEVRAGGAGGVQLCDKSGAAAARRGGTPGLGSTAGCVWLLHLAGASNPALLGQPP